MTEAPFRSPLLVEDEANLAIALKIALKKLGMPARHATTIQGARAEIAAQAPDFILLDRNLPDGDGLDLCRDLRESGYAGVILMLTAIGETQEKVRGLDAGADDYLPKPFSWAELEARVRALARRRPAAEAPLAASALPETWHLDDSRLRIRGPHGWTELTPLEYKLASKLIGGRGSILSRDELLKDVWGFTLLPKTRTVDHFMGRLRKHFETNPEKPVHFLTVRGAGYRFEP
jgi:DNA-binding response OmpR family regulator